MSSNNFGLIDDCSSCRGHRRIWIRNLHDTSLGICAQWLTSLLFARDRRLDSGLSFFVSLARNGASVAGSEFLDVLSSLNSPSGSCFIKDKIAFHKISYWMQQYVLACPADRTVAERIAQRKAATTVYGTRRRNGGGHRVERPCVLQGRTPCDEASLTRHEAASGGGWMVVLPWKHPTAPNCRRWRWCTAAAAAAAAYKEDQNGERNVDDDFGLCMNGIDR